jgi:hypothetical protein
MSDKSNADKTYRLLITKYSPNNKYILKTARINDNSTQKQEHLLTSQNVSTPARLSPSFMLPKYGANIQSVKGLYKINLIS